MFIMLYNILLPINHYIGTGGSCLSQIFWEHENLSGLSIIQVIQLLLLKDNSCSGI